MPNLEELWELHYVYQCWWSSLNHPPYTNISESTFNLVLPCIFAHFVLQLSSWTHTYPFRLRGVMLDTQSSMVYVMKPTHKKIEKIDQHLRIQPLRGGNLLYFTQMNDSLMIQMIEPPSYIGI